MSNVIGFLETMGQDAGLRLANRGTLHRALNEHAIDVDAQWAILRRDSKHLESLLASPNIVCCFLAPKKDGEEDEEPQKDDDEVTSQAFVRCIASAA